MSDAKLLLIKEDMYIFEKKIISNESFIYKEHEFQVSDAYLTSFRSCEFFHALVLLCFIQAEVN